MLTDCINDAIVGEDIFPDSLKFGDITSVHIHRYFSNNSSKVEVMVLISKFLNSYICKNKYS